MSQRKRGNELFEYYSKLVAGEGDEEVSEGSNKRMKSTEMEGEGSNKRMKSTEMKGEGSNK